MSAVPQFDIDEENCSKTLHPRINAAEGIVHGIKNVHNRTTHAITKCRIQISVPKGYYALAYLHRVSCNFLTLMEVSAEDWAAVPLNQVTWQCPLLLPGDMRLYTDEPFQPKSTFFLSDRDNFTISVWSADGPVGDFWVYFKGVSEYLRDRFHVVHDNEAFTSGYVTLPGFGEDFLYQSVLNVSHDILVPTDHTLVISFPYFDLQGVRDEYALKTTLHSDLCEDFLELRTLASGESHGMFIWRKCGVESINASMYDHSVRMTFFSDVVQTRTGFKLLFSLHNASVSPVQSANGLFDCSRHYDTFRQHLDYNLRQECQDGKDEHQECPYITDQGPSCQSGAVNVQGKCVSYHAFEAGRQYTTWQGARLECQRLGGDLAMPKTPEQLDRIHDIMRIKPKGRCAYVGLQTVPVSSSTQSMYRKTLRWVDETTCFYGNMSIYSDSVRLHNVITRFENLKYSSLYKTYCFAVFLNEIGRYYLVKCAENMCRTFMCETQSEKQENVLKAPAFQTPITFPYFNPNRSVECPSGHMTHSFLACDPQSHCGVKHYVTRCRLYVTDNGTVTKPQAGGRASSVGQLVSVEMFECYTMGETIPYTLVCDFRRDCQDGSDELHCVHKENATGFRYVGRHPTGAAGQEKQRWGYRFEPWFCYWELGWGGPKYYSHAIESLNQPAINEYTRFNSLCRCRSGQHISFEDVCDVKDDCLDGSDELSCVQLERVDNSSFHRSPAPVTIHMDGRGNFTQERMDPADPTCPQTHFRCPGQHVYCMPVYLRCNGVKDCPGGEDEVSCDDVTCPGYYRCRSSSVCLHGSHLCDGWPQCPERDDELLCNASCPSACHCQGLAFACQQPFAASHYSDLRYLDATGSGMVPEDVADNFYLVYLSLAACGLETWPAITLTNLQRLDLSHNVLETFPMQQALLLNNLRVLNLKGNPLQWVEAHNLTVHHASLKSVDMSFTKLKQFNRGLLTPFNGIEHLNLSFSVTEELGDSAFADLPKLLTIDLRGSNLPYFSSRVFTGLDNLKLILADNYRVCCKDVLPASFNTENCISPQNSLSSCDDLLRSNSYRLYVWIVGLVAVLSNISLVVIRRTSKNSQETEHGFRAFLNTLNVANGLTGVYLLIIAAADTIHRGNYFAREIDWKAGVVCKLAGVLFVLSVEVSIFIICFIALDRFIVLCFSSQKIEGFKGRSAVSALALAWTVGFLLAAVPLFPSLSHWSFYSQTGICIPLPVNEYDYPARQFLSGLLSTTCLVVVSVMAFEVALLKTMAGMRHVDSMAISGSRDVDTARSVHAVLVCDAVCWIAVYVSALLALFNSQVFKDSGIITALFVLPLPSALNPLICLYNMQMDRRRTLKEQHIAKLLKTSKPLRK